MFTMKVAGCLLCLMIFSCFLQGFRMGSIMHEDKMVPLACALALYKVGRRTRSGVVESDQCEYLKHQSSCYGVA